jgi:CHAT domain-containing protein
MSTRPAYLDFDLQIRREGDRYMAEVRASPAGTTGREPLKWPFGIDSHDVLRLKLENAILKGRGYRSGGPMTNEEAILHAFGKEVFRAVFRDSGEVAQKFASSLDMVQKEGDKVAGLRMKLRVEPPELASLPWEYMFDEAQKNPNLLQNYLCLRHRSPLVRFLDVNGPDVPLRIDGPLRVLGMIANPGTPEWEKLDTEAERHRIEEALEESKADVDFQWVTGGTADDLYRSVRRGSWHIFHFIGHGGTDHYMNDQGETRSEGFVVMQDGLGGAVKVMASQLALTLEGDPNLRLAVLNCCESGSGSLTSVGAALVNSSVPMAVSMQFPITNGSAARFAGTFYEALVKGQPVEKALTEARIFVRVKSNLEWAIPVLFTRSGSCVLFDVEPRKDPQATLPPVAAASVVDTAAAQALARKAQAQEELRRLFNQGG